MPEFATPRPVTAVVRLPAGALEITAEERDTALVDVRPYDDRPASHEAAERTTVELHGDTLAVTAPDGGWMAARPASLLITIHVPLDSRLRLKTAAADTTCRGRISALDAVAASGDLVLEHIAGDAKVQIASGDVTAGQVDGELRVSGAAGDVTARRVGGPVDTSVASGSIDIGAAGSGVKAKTASGRVRIGATRRGTVKVQTASGDVAVGVLSGTGVWLDLATISGHTVNELDMTSTGGGEAGHDLSVEVRTASGDIAISRVPAEAAAA
ncbi:DUF4097 family beta strand repeat-containing protein [Phytohabitans suffuscus]|uniref:DUF4097 domain-containing protein n=1 Tax=Phytohabitans suffuscus TaxID=624315 RepID=A0A6F8YNM1_9ACTN|nr:DUF4097 family beta strand repeat-containing protein [Phytohabitans suffuscus]BCB87727.1 hypothetical protein Psuf_050400 [Phytohabitans suffuscus]